MKTRRLSFPGVSHWTGPNFVTAVAEKDSGKGGTGTVIWAWTIHEVLTASNKCCQQEHSSISKEGGNGQSTKQCLPQQSCMWSVRLTS